jgi:uncharacterized protein (TIGR00725 family)
MTVQIAAIGSSDATESLSNVAEEIGHALAAAGAVIVTGGLGGVMAAACRGAKSANGLTVGILSGNRSSSGEPNGLM